MLIHNPIFTGSISLNGTDISQISTVSTDSSSFAQRITNNESTSSAFVVASSSLAARLTSNEAITGSFATTSSLALTSASVAAINVRTGSFATTGSNQFNGNQTVTGSLTATGTIVAQTLVVQTVTSSVVYSSGSNIFGLNSGNSHQFTGSVLVSGSTTFSGSVDVNSNITIPNGSYYKARRSTSSTAIDVVGFASSSDTLVIKGGTSGTAVSMQFQDTAGAVMSLYNNRVGIGTTSPGDKLVVIAPANEWAGVFVGNNTTNQSFGIQVFGGTNSADTAFRVLNGAQSSTYMIVRGDGNVGIGSSSPAKKLDIFDNNVNGTDDIVRAYQDVTTNHAFYRSQRNGGANMLIGATRSNTDGNLVANTSIVWNVSNHDMLLGTNNTERIRIISGGNVGINTPTPLERLSVTGNAHIAGVGNSLYFDTDGSGRAIYQTVANLYEFHIVNGRGNSARFILGNGSISLGTSATPQLFINTGNGNTGIGTTSPNARLDLGGSYGASGEKFFIYNDNNTSALAGTKVGFYMDRFGLANNSTYVFPTSAANPGSYIISSKDTSGTTLVARVTVLGETGRVGIGITTPGAGLQVALPGVDDQLILGSIANNRDHAMFMCSGPNQAEIFRYQSGVRLILAASTSISNVDVIPGGSVGVRLSAGNTSWSAYTSDARRKKNFETVPGLDAIMQVEPVKYHFNIQDDSEVKKLGFTAQNLLPLIPEMVHPNGEKEEDGSDTLTIIPDYILPVLVKAIQEQQAQIDELKTLLNA